MSEPKKVSFGFKSTKKLVPIQKPIVEAKKVELIDCLEGKSIRVKNEVKTTKAPLVIPIKDNGKNLLDRVREANDLKERSRKKLAVEDDRPDSELTLDELAARQLIREAKNFDSKPSAGAKVHVLPALEDKLLLEGSVEPTLEDYENVPIGDYGMAMLRGMGWTATAGIGKNSKMTTTSTPAPEMRPKGMGLGAGRLMAQEKTKPAVDKDGKELTLQKGVYARIVNGKLKGNYCIVQGLDDEAGRVIVKTTLMGTVLSLNEFLLTPVTKEEYIRSAKVLNNAKYEEYKNQEARTDEAARQNGKLKPEKDKPSKNSLEYEMQKKAAQASGSDKKHKITIDDDTTPPKKKNGDSKSAKKNYRRRPSSSESEEVETRRSSSKSSAKKYGDKKKKRDSSRSSSRSYRSASREYEDKAKKRKKGKAEKYKGRRRSSESSSSSDSEYDSRRSRYRRSSSRSSYDRSSSDRDRYKRRRRSSSYSDRDDRRSRSRRRSYTPRSSRSRSTDSDRRRGRGSRRYSSDSYSN